MRSEAKKYVAQQDALHRYRLCDKRSFGISDGKTRTRLDCLEVTQRQAPLNIGV